MVEMASSIVSLYVQPLSAFVSGVGLPWRVALRCRVLAFRDVWSVDDRATDARSFSGIGRSGREGPSGIGNLVSFAGMPTGKSEGCVHPAQLVPVQGAESAEK
jgi:hypothetical protein